MKAIVKEDPTEAGNRWNIYTKKWYSVRWTYRDSCWGDKAKERAVELAKKYLKPETIEVKV